MLATRARGAARRADEQPAASLTLLTTMLDFSDTGVLDVYIDEAYVAAAREGARRQDGGTSA